MGSQELVSLQQGLWRRYQLLWGTAGVGENRSEILGSGQEAVPPFDGSLLWSQFLTDNLSCLEAILSRALGRVGACGTRLQGRLSVLLSQATALSASADREKSPIESYLHRT